MLPSFKVIDVPGATLAFAPIDKRITPEALRRCLCAREISAYQSIQRQERRNEWLGGRICAKAAIIRQWSMLPLSETPIRHNTLEIRNDVTGKPHLHYTLHDTPLEIPISISHTHRHTAAMASSRQVRIGIDIETIAPRIMDVMPRFLAPGDELFMRSQEPDAALAWLTRLWCAKEAVSKALGLGLALDFRTLHVTKWTNTNISFLRHDASHRHRMTVRLFTMDPTCVGAYTFLKSEQAC